MRAAELQDITVEGLGLLPVDRVSGLGQHDELGSVSAVKLLRLDFLRPFPSQSECKIYVRSGLRSENRQGRSRHIPVNNESRSNGSILRAASGQARLTMTGSIFRSFLR